MSQVGLPSRRRGETLLTVLAGIFVMALVSSLVVTLYQAAQETSDAGTRRVRVTETARRITARFREDVRAAAAVEGGGAELTLETPRGAVSYRWRAGVLSRIAAGGAEADTYGASLRSVHFRREGRLVHLQLSLEDRRGRRPIALTTACVAAPRAR